MDRADKRFAEFIGAHSLEDDNGWSHEVFRAGYIVGEEDICEWMERHAPMTYQAYLNKENL